MTLNDVRMAIAEAVIKYEKETENEYIHYIEVSREHYDTIGQPHRGIVICIHTLNEKGTHYVSATSQSINENEK